MRAFFLTVAMLGAVGLVATAGAARRSVPVPQTLVTAKGPILAFAQDGSRIAWTTAGVSCPSVHLRVLASGRQYPLTPPSGDTCGSTAPQPTSALALAGNRALWAFDDFSNTAEGVEVAVGSPARRDKVVATNEFDCGTDCGNEPLHSASVAAAGSTLVCALPGGDSSGEVDRVVGDRAVTVDDLAEGGGRLVATDGARIAVAGTTLGGLPVTQDAAWSPTGSEIAFDSFRDGYSAGIYVVSAAGGAWRRLTSGYEPAWSPSGKQIAYIIPTSGRLHVLDLSTHRNRVLPARGEWPAWSPDGSKIAFVGGGGFGGIDVIRSNGKGLHLLFPAPRNDPLATLESPSWSPDGSRIAYSVFGDIKPDELVVGRADGSSSQVISTGSEPTEDPAWSPDGKKIAVGGAGSIVVLNPDGSDPVTLPSPPMLGAYSNSAVRPSWSPDGSAIVFQWGEFEVETDLWVVNSDGSGTHRLTTTVPKRPADYVDITTKAGRQRASLAESARAVAISPSALAVLRGGEIDLYSMHGRLLRRVRARDAAAQLAMAGTRLVFRAGRSIELLDIATGDVTRIAYAAATPIGLSISGGRIGWAENVGGHGRIVTVQLPAGAA